MKKDKARDIARSVLPSTHRKAARDDKRAYHSKHRAAQRQANHRIERSLAVETDDGSIAHDPELFDDFEERTVYDGYAAATKDDGLSWDDMNEIVQNRRNGDKLGPLLSWARAVHDRTMSGPEWTTADKLAYFKAVLPDTLQGRHALSHIETDLGLLSNPYLYGRYSYRSQPAATKDEFRAALGRILSTSKGRMDFHDFRLAKVPAAAHVSTANNRIRTRVQAVNENGEGLYLDTTNPLLIRTTTDKKISRYVERRPYMVEAYVPQPIAVSCEVCSFLRNDPLADTDAINRLVDIVWKGIKRARYRFDKDRNIDADHAFLVEIRDYVIEEGK
jgi:hypothetical protein